MAAGLRLGLINEGQYPEAVAEEFRQLVAAIQQWAGGTGFGSIPNDATIGGQITAQSQPSFRAFYAGSPQIPTGVEYPISWRTPSTDPTAFAEWDTTGMFESPSKVWLSQPGIYLIQARVSWGASTAGSFRILQVRIYGDDLDGDIARDAPTANLVQRVACIVRISQDLLDRALYPRGIPVQIEGVQDSGSDRSIADTSWFSVAKLF